MRLYKATILFAAILSMFLHSAIGQREAPVNGNQPEGLEQIYTKLRELGQRCQFGRSRVTDARFVQQVVEYKMLIDSYTLEHEITDHNWHMWSSSFADAYHLAGTQWKQGYPAAERLLREGVDLLANVRTDRPLATRQTALRMYVLHVHHWLPTHPEQSAQLWDSVGQWVWTSGMTELVTRWQFHQATIEARLLAAGDGLPQGRRAVFAAWRMRTIADYLANPNITVKHRATALRCVSDYLFKAGRTPKAIPLMEGFALRDDAPPDYYHARMLVALFGEGDWEKATETLARLNNRGVGGAMKPSEHRSRQSAHDLYYGNIFLSSLELLQRGQAGNNDAVAVE